MGRLSRKEVLLHTAFLLTTLGDRMWMFVIGLFMHKLGGMSWVAAQQLIDSATKLFILTTCGQYLDRVDRSKIIQRSLFLNNVAVTASAAVFAVMFFYVQLEAYSTALLVTATFFAAISRVASEVQRICFTKDWVVVIAKTEDVNLSKINSFLMCIDQVSSAVLPFATGKLLDTFPWEIVCASIVIYNLTSWGMESYILSTLYNETKQLKTRESEIIGDEELRGLKGFGLGAVRKYFRQSSWMAGFGLSLLYMTVLGFDNLAASYGQKHGMSAAYIGFLRGFGSVLGILGAASFQFVANKVGLLWTVVIGLTWQNIFINTSGVSVLLPGSPMDVQGFFETTNLTTVGDWANAAFHRVAHPEKNEVPYVPYSEVPFSITLFFLGISFARYGLWLADPAITQIQQETIPDSQRYAVFTVQTSLCELFSIIKDLVVIACPYTPLFGMLTLGSCGFVFVGFLLNLFYHAQCGFSCSNKKMHIKELPESEMVEMATPERQSLIGDNSQEKKEVVEVDETREQDE